MSRSNWGRYVAIVGFALIMSASNAWAQDVKNSPNTALKEQPISGQQDADSRPNSETESSEQEENSAQVENEPVIQEFHPSSGDQISEIGQEERQRYEEREIRDLKAQEEMAYWARSMFHASAVAVLVTFAGLILLWRTLIHTRHAATHAGEMVIEARLTTAASESTVDVTREIGEAQTRAYAQITKASVRMETHDGVNYGDSPNITIEVNNTGNSPARAFRWNVKSVYIYEGSECDLRGNTGIAPENWGVDLSPNIPTTLSSKCLPSFMTGNDIAAFGSGNLHMFVTINTLFLDVFKQEISSEYHFGAHFPVGELGVDVKLNRCPTGAEEMANMADLGRTIQLPEDSDQN